MAVGPGYRKRLRALTVDDDEDEHIEKYTGSIEQLTHNYSDTPLKVKKKEQLGFWTQARARAEELERVGTHKKKGKRTRKPTGRRRTDRVRTR